ncbi:MAG: glycosyltransferase family 2 protein [Burkholderiaceae bacterium]
MRHQLERVRSQGLRSVFEQLTSHAREDRWSTPDQVVAYRRLLERLDREDRDVRAEFESADGPLISILMPVWNTPADMLREAIGSVRNQVYPHWELCIADDASDAPATLAALASVEAADDRIRIVRRSANGHICVASTEALAIATGQFVAFLDHDDRLHPFALGWMAREVAACPQADLIYSDEDKIDEAGRRFQPHLKPDFNYELLLSQNYVCHLAMYRRAVVADLGGLRPGFEGSQDHDLVLRVVEHSGAARIRHVPRILYHWRVHTMSTASAPAAKPYAWLAGRRAVEGHLHRSGMEASVDEAPDAPTLYRPKFPVPQPIPSVEVIVPTRDRLDLLRQCIDSIRARTRYGNYRICVVDNGSVEPETLACLERWRAGFGLRVLRIEAPFNFSMLNNRAVATSDCDFVVLLNNDIEVGSTDWIDEMVSHAARPGVGCVGARLWYPDDTLQHGGVVLGINGVAAHAHKSLRRGLPGYFGRAVVLQSFSAVTAACLMVRRDTYLKAGGMDESLAVAFNDIDFCLRVRQQGFRTVWTPFAELVHHESASRGLDVEPSKRARFEAEAASMRKRWGPLLDRDPAYSPHLTLQREDFSIWP